MTEEARAQAQAALAIARTKDPLIHTLGGHPIEPPLPAPIGADCPDHETYPLVLVDGDAWCRRGQHVPELEASSA